MFYVSIVKSSHSTDACSRVSYVEQEILSEVDVEQLVAAIDEIRLVPKATVETFFQRNRSRDLRSDRGRWDGV